MHTVWLSTHGRYDVTVQMAVPNMAQSLREHLGMTTDYEVPSDQANRIVRGAYQFLERQLCRPLLTQTRQYRYTRIPMPGVLIADTPVQSISKVVAVDKEDAEHIIDAERYRVLGVGDGAHQPHPCTITVKHTPVCWGIASDVVLEDQPYPFMVECVSGWQEETLPEPLAQAALFIAADWWQQKRTATDMPVYRVPHGVRQIVGEYRRAKLEVM